MFAANLQPIASSYLTQFHLLAAEAWHAQQKCIKQRGTTSGSGKKFI